MRGEGRIDFADEVIVQLACLSICVTRPLWKLVTVSAVLVDNVLQAQRLPVDNYLIYDKYKLYFSENAWSAGDELSGT